MRKSKSIPRKIRREKIREVARGLNEGAGGPSKVIPATALVDRHQAAVILNVCCMTVKRIEWDGKLKAVKLRPGPKAKTFYRKDDVYGLAGVPIPENA